MTLDEAIRHAEQTAASCDGECADDHWQLADWLRELRRARMEIDLLKTLRDGFKADARKYKAENAKLQGDIVAHALNNGLLVKCVTDRNDALKELVFEMHQTMVDRCNGSHEPYHGKPCSSCAEAGSADCPKVIAERMRKLGIEVDDG